MALSPVIRDFISGFLYFSKSFTTNANMPTGEIQALLEI